MPRYERLDFFQGEDTDLYFTTGAKPDQKAFKALMDSFLNIEDDDIHPVSQGGREVYIGIGEKTPQEKLHVDGNFRVDGNIKIQTGSKIFTKGNRKLNLYSNENATNSRSWIELWGNDNSRQGELSLAGEYIQFFTGSNEGAVGNRSLRITKDGNVGIGVNNNNPDPGFKLHVNGNIKINGGAQILGNTDIDGNLSGIRELEFNPLVESTLDLKSRTKFKIGNFEVDYEIEGGTRTWRLKVLALNRSEPGVYREIFNIDNDGNYWILGNSRAQ